MTNSLYNKYNKIGMGCVCSMPRKARHCSNLTVLHFPLPCSQILVQNRSSGRRNGIVWWFGALISIIRLVIFKQLVWKAVVLFMWGFALLVWLFIYFFPPFSFVFVVTFAKQIQACSCCSNGWLNQDSLLVFNTPHRVIVCAFSVNFDF